MRLAEQYLKLVEGNKVIPPKLNTAIERLKKKPVAARAEMGMSLLSALVEKLSETPQGVRVLKEFATDAYALVVKGVAVGEKDHSVFIEYFRSFYDPEHEDVLYPEMIGSGWTDKDIIAGIKKRGDQFEGDSMDREAIRDMLIDKFGEGSDKISEAEFKLSSKQENAVAFIKQQIDLDLNPYIDAKYSSRKYFNFDMEKVPDIAQRRLKSLAATNGKTVFKLADNGGMGTALYAL